LTKVATEVEIQDIEGLKKRLAGSQLCVEDITAITSILNTFVVLQELVRKRRISILKFLRRIFGFKTEKFIENPTSEPKNEGEKSPKEKGSPRPGRNGRNDYPGAEKIKVKHPHLTRGCKCPECLQGILNEAEPAVDYDWQGHSPIVLKIYLLERFICHICKMTFTAPSPIAEKAKTVDDSQDEVKVGRCDRNAMANAVIAVLRFWYGVPHYRLAKIQGTMGMALPVATQYRMVLQVYGAALAVYMHMMEEAAQGALLFADDTSIKIFDWLAGKGPLNKSNDERKKKANTTAIVSRIGEKTIVLYLTSAEQAGSKVETLLEKRDEELEAPIYMCDGLAANDPGSGHTVIRVNCLDHARRQFFDLITVYPRDCAYILAEIAKIYKTDDETKTAKMSEQQRLEHHQKYSRPVMDALGKWFTEHLNEEKVEENDALGTAINYSLKRWTEINEFHHIPGVPLSNAECERAIKSIIRHRKNSLAYKTENGAKVGDVNQSLIATCEYAGVNPFKYLEWIQMKKSLAKENPQDFTPWAYKSFSIEN
jgi:hypothetical protein